MIANANAPRTLNTGFMGQRGSVGTQRPLTEFEQAHLIAQRNAALPVSQGGLGLAPDNTAMDRARALGFDVDTPVYHGTRREFDSFELSNPRGAIGNPKGVYFDTDKNVAREYAENVDGEFDNKSKVIEVVVNKNKSEIRPRVERGLKQSEIIVYDPKNIRSRFAAFDPMKKESSNLLAQFGALAPTATMAAYLYNQERNKGGKQ